jgi:hypothetical protein
MKFLILSLLFAQLCLQGANNPVTTLTFHSELIEDSVLRKPEVRSSAHEIHIRAEYPGNIVDITGSADSVFSAQVITYTQELLIVKTKKGKRLKRANYFYYIDSLSPDIAFKLAKYLLSHSREIAGNLSNDTSTLYTRSCRQHSYAFKLKGDYTDGSLRCASTYNIPLHKVESYDAAYVYLDSILQFETRGDQLFHSAPKGRPYCADNYQIRLFPVGKKQERMKCSFPRKWVGED